MDTTQKAGAPHVTQADLQALMDKSDLPILVDFYADWCGPCKLAAPIIDKLSEEYKGKAEIVKLNTDEENAVAQEHGVMSIPTVIVFGKKDGKVQEITRKIGFPGESGYRQMLEQVVPATAKAA